MHELTEGSVPIGEVAGFEVRLRYSHEFPELDYAARLAWHECVELRQQPLREFVEGVLESVTTDSLRVAAYREGQPVAITVFAVEQDPHVGACLSVQWNYCSKAFRASGWGRVVVRLLQKCMRELGIPTGCYTQRRGPGVYMLKYITHRGAFRG